MITILCGYSGSGKNTIMEELKKLGFKNIITCTTRPMRENEKQDREYHFLTEEEFTKKEENGEFLETTSYNASFGKCRYGTLKADIKEKRCIILNPDGIKIFKDKNIPANIIFLKADKETLKTRLSKRGDAPEEINRRLKADENDFKDIFSLPEIYIIDTEKSTPEETAKTIKNLIDEKGEK